MPMLPRELLMRVLKLGAFGVTCKSELGVCANATE